jgi:hypothetical protein
MINARTEPWNATTAKFFLLALLVLIGNGTVNSDFVIGPTAYIDPSVWVDGHVYIYRPAADRAVFDVALVIHRVVNENIDRLTAIGALDRFGRQHAVARVAEVPIGDHLNIPLTQALSCRCRRALLS